MSDSSILTRKPLLSFFSLTYIISWGIWIPLVTYYYLSPFPVSLASTPILLILCAFLGFFGPTFAALIMAGLERGRSEIKSLLLGWKRWRVGIQWYLVILVSQVVIDLVGTQVCISAFGLTPEVNWSAWAVVFPTFLRAALIGGAIAEETGWRGYALPRLLKSKSALTSSLTIGLIWAAWHLPISLIPGANFPVPLSPLVFGVFSLNAVFLSVIMTWLFTNTRGSIFICYLYHALLNTALLGALFHFENLEFTWWVKMCCSTALHGIFALLLVLFFGPARLSRKVEGEPWLDRGVSHGVEAAEPSRTE
jgi:membrane protease YdiL (CAAX protease family)